MNRCVFRLFKQNLSAFLRNYTCSVVAHNVLKIGRSDVIQKCHKSSVTLDSSKLPSSFSSDDFDLNEDSLRTQVDFEAITKGDPNKLNKLKILQLEINLLKLHNSSIPASLSTENWEELMMINGRKQRKKYLYKLWYKETQKKHKNDIKLKKKAAYEEFKNMQSQQETVKILTTASPMVYKLMATSIFHRIQENLINQLDNYRLLQAEWFGPQIIIDCSYDSFMSRKNIGLCVHQMMLMWSRNRENLKPYDIFFCNFDRNGPLWQQFYKIFPNIEELDTPVHYTDQHYLNFFPRERLVYLTPHCSEVLYEYNPNDVYIIGAYVDAGSVEPLSLVKAKKERLRRAKLPLDRYRKWKCGPKSLNMNTVMAIINDLKDGHSWHEALKHVPKGRVEVEEYSDCSDNSRKFNCNIAASIRENYRRNLVYDLLLKEKFKPPPNEN